MYYYRITPSERLSVSDNTFVFFKYREGAWESLIEKINRIITNDGLTIDRLQIINAEQEYDKYYHSEKVLLKLLYFVLAVCVIICIFGFVALVSQTCAERRKSIAIRKINGALMSDILTMFAKEYFALLLIGAAIAFSAGYFIMQRWLEQYVTQTVIPLWIYLSILIVMALVIVLCVGWQVYRVSVERPAKEIKSE
jgi:ABC-type antimicrobial peptide transport system permease subunit